MGRSTVDVSPSLDGHVPRPGVGVESPFGAARTLFDVGIDLRREDEAAVRRAAEMAGERIDGKDEPIGQAVVTFYEKLAARATMEIFLNFRPEGGTTAQDAATNLSPLAHIERHLAWGKQSGEFRPFSIRVMAMAIQRAPDGLPFLLGADPDADLAEYADELVQLVTRATAAAP